MQSIRRGTGRAGVKNPIVFYLAVLLYAFLAFLISIAALAPLGALLVFEQGSALQYLALLSPLALILIVMPLRFSFAQALSDRFHARPFSLNKGFGFSLYGEKVAEGFLYLLHLLKWALPLLLYGGAMYLLVFDAKAFTEPVANIIAIGETVTGIWRSVANFFAGIFGGAQNMLPGGFGEGVVFLLVVAGVCLLILLIGIIRNSAYRYIWAEATELDKNPRMEGRRSLRGRRLRQLSVALMNLVLFSPVLIVSYLFFAPKEAMADFTLRVLDILTGEAVLPPLAVPYGKLALIVLVCWLPLVPLRRMITAHFATARLRSLSAPNQPGTGGGQEPMPPLYQDMPVQGGRNPQ